MDAANVGLPLARLRKLVFVQRHVYASTPECNTLHAQAKSLLGRLLPGKLDGAAGTDHSLPG
jgi:hypothetical protein